MGGIEYILDEWSKKRKSELIERYISMKLKASGAFEKGLTVETEGYKTTIFTEPHTWFMVNGRAANEKKDPESLRKWVGWAGSTFLKKWVDDKGLDISPFAVAGKIARHGVTVPNNPPNNFNDGTLISSVINQSTFDLLNKELGLFIVSEIKSDIQKTWQQNQL